MKRYGLFIAAVLLFLLTVLVVVVLEYRPGRRSPSQQLQEAIVELSRLRASKHHQSYLLSIASSNKDLENRVWKAELTEKLEEIDSQIKDAEAEIAELEAELHKPVIVNGQ